jgi:hypothetical protein
MKSPRLRPSRSLLLLRLPTEAVSQCSDLWPVDRALPLSGKESELVEQSPAQDVRNDPPSDKVLVKRSAKEKDESASSSLSPIKTSTLPLALRY